MEGVTSPILPPVKILATASGYKIVDAAERAVCYVYATHGSANPAGFSNDEALDVVKRIARLLSDSDPSASPATGDRRRQAPGA